VPYTRLHGGRDSVEGIATRYAAYNVTLAERLPGAYRLTRRKKHPVFQALLNIMY
jgi:hypothetical protein